MKFKIFYSILFIALLVSCENNENTIDADNLLLGHWVQPSYTGDETTFSRSSSLPNEAYGVTFNSKGVFIERSSGFCGTPPLTFFNTEGSFKTENTLIEITKDVFPNNFNWRIIELTEQKLVVKRELSEQEIEHRALMDLFNTIENLVYSATCSDANNWTFTAYGSKACGGSQGYLPYSKNIDTVAFLQKIDSYTKAEKEFNIKWKIISTCDIPNEPIAVECRQGYPILVY